VKKMINLTKPEIKQLVKLTLKSSDNNPYKGEKIGKH